MVPTAFNGFGNCDGILIPLNCSGILSKGTLSKVNVVFLHFDSFFQLVCFVQRKLANIVSVGGIVGLEGDYDASDALADCGMARDLVKVLD